MNRVCWRLQSQDLFLGLKVDKLFTSKKDAQIYFHTYCMGCGIIQKVRAKSDKKKFYQSVDVTPDVEITIPDVRDRKG